MNHKNSTLKYKKTVVAAYFCLFGHWKYLRKCSKSISWHFIELNHKYSLVPKLLTKQLPFKDKEEDPKSVATPLVF